LPPPEIGQPVEKPTQMPRVTDFSDFFVEDLIKGSSVPCANNPDKFYDPNVKYIMNPCRDYDKPSGEDFMKNLPDDFVIFN
jgi:hypothetical protein